MAEARDIAVELIGGVLRHTDELDQPRAQALAQIAIAEALLEVADAIRTAGSGDLDG